MGGRRGEMVGKSDYGGMVQPSQQHVALCLKEVESRLGTRGFRIVAAFWAGIPRQSLINYSCNFFDGVYIEVHVSINTTISH